MEENRQLYKKIVEAIRESQELNKIPAFAYARISSDVQDDGNSRENQEENTRSYATRNHLHLTHIFNVIESAKNEGRKVFNQMLDLALYFGVRNIVFKSSDRMSHNFPDLNRIEKLVDNQDFCIHFFQDRRIFSKESNHTDRMYLGIEMTINKHWSDKISYDVRMANKYKALKGVAPCRALFGYVYNKEKKQHEIDSTVEKGLRYIFDSFDNGDYSLKQFVRFINKAGVTNRTGKKWTKGNLYSLLTKNFYCGDFLYQGDVYKGNHQPYFSKHRFEARMQRLGSSYVGWTENESTFLLAKYLKCACGLMMTGDLKKVDTSITNILAPMRASRYIYPKNRFLKYWILLSEI